MNIQEITVKNFRLLKDTTLTLNEQTTVVVGRNNSGKTSLTEIARRLLKDGKPNFRLEDFSLSTHEDFWEAFRIKQDGDDDIVREKLPTIEVILKVKYDTTESNLGALSDFIIDLDPDSETVIISISYQISSGKISQLFDDLKFEEAEKSKFYKKIKERIPSLYQIQLFAIDPTDKENTKQLDWNRLQAFLSSGFINAQRGLDDETYQDKDVLGKILEVLFNSANSDEASEADKIIADQLKLAADGLQTNIESGFSESLKKFIPALSIFGYPGLSDPELNTETTVDVDQLLKNHTRIRYKGSGSVDLPESFNGLGTRNLIYILFKLFEFFKEFQASTSEPGVQLIFIEEPEAHLHPQMQEVFIRQLNAIAKIFIDAYYPDGNWPVQFVVSTHSSHIANTAPFDAIRYFITGAVSDTDLNRHTRIKDLSVGLSATTSNTKEFLHKYMTLTRCDLLFADKAILVEGATERIILPVIIEKNDVGRVPEQCLASQYLTIMEVGGAYAHKFFDLLEFLEIQTLIITDIDTTIKKVNASKTTTYTKCKVSEGTHTSNATINDWFNINAGSGIPSANLINKKEDDKIKGKKYITYQLPETSSDPCGRSFEATFMLANQTLFGISKTNLKDKEEEVWVKSEGIKKTEFALKYSIDVTNWAIPLYIKNGLDWLANTPVSTKSKTK